MKHEEVKALTKVRIPPHYGFTDPGLHWLIANGFKMKMDRNNIYMVRPVWGVKS